MTIETEYSKTHMSDIIAKYLQILSVVMKSGYRQEKLDHKT